MATALASLVLAPAGQAATREPLSPALAALHNPGAALTNVRPDPRALRAAQAGRASRVDAGGGEVRISSTSYGSDQMAAITATLERLDHGPEMAQLSVYVATPAEIAEICGATVVACYVPSRMEMVVSGIDRSVAGVPRDFAIAHEYGHHIANTQRGDLYPAIDVGTIRWATYERVCQFTRAGKLYPGSQGAHYFEDPEEAFAESFAHLSQPDAGVSWQYTSLLRPTATSLTKIHADVTRPWTGTVTSTVTGTLSPPAAVPAPAPGTDAHAGLDGATAVGAPPSLASRLIRTPLDGTVSVTVQAPPGAELAVSLRDPDRGRGRVLAHAATGATGSAELSYSNCGHAALRLDVRSLQGAGVFEATVVRP